MKKKTLIIIICLLSLILLILGFAYYRLFFSNTKTDDVKNEKRHQNKINDIYICQKNYGNEKYYSLTNDNNCVKRKFSCSNCDIESYYYDNIVIYYTNNKTVNIYDLNKNENIESIDVYVGEGGDVQAWVDFYTQDNKIYGFTYYNDYDSEIKFYNITLMKTIGSIDGKICKPTRDSTFSPCDFSYPEDTDLIKNNLAIIAKKLDDNSSSSYLSNYGYGLINLKTGDLIIEPTKSYLYTINDYYVSDSDYINKKGFCLYDKDGNILFDNNEDNQLFYGYLIAGTNDGYFVVFNDSYVLIIDKNGNVLNNSRIKKSEINNKIYNKITNMDAKSNFSDDEGFFYSVYKDNTYISKDENDNLYINIGYSDSYYETYVGIMYKYNIKESTLEEYSYEEDIHVD